MGEGLQEVSSLVVYVALVSTKLTTCKDYSWPFGYSISLLSYSNSSSLQSITSLQAGARMFRIRATKEQAGWSEEGLGKVGERL